MPLFRKDHIRSKLTWDQSSQTQRVDPVLLLPSHQNTIVPASSRSTSKRVQGLFMHPSILSLPPLDFIYTGLVVRWVSCGRDPAWLGWRLPIFMRREPLARVQIPAAAPQHSGKPARVQERSLSRSLTHSRPNSRLVALPLSPNPEP